MPGTRTFAAGDDSGRSIAKVVDCFLIADPLAHLDLSAILAIWPRLSEAQQAACAAHRGVGVDDLEGLYEDAQPVPATPSPSV